MSIAANTQPNQGSPWGNTGQGTAPWNWQSPPFWHPRGLSRPVGIAAMVLGFALWWPVGLALLFFMIFSGRIGCRSRNWAREQGNQWQSAMPNWCGGGGNGQQKPSGNAAFDEYKAQTLRRLEEEQTEFSGFLERLRFAKDKAEFDQFMAERRQAPRPPAVPDQPSHG